MKYIYNHKHRFFTCAPCCYSKKEAKKEAKIFWLKENKKLKYIDYLQNNYKY